MRVGKRSHFAEKQNVKSLPLESQFVQDGKGFWYHVSSVEISKSQVFKKSGINVFLCIKPKVVPAPAPAPAITAPAPAPATTADTRTEDAVAPAPAPTTDDSTADTPEDPTNATTDTPGTSFMGICHVATSFPAHTST